MTLVELLVSMSVLGLIVTVVAAAITVVLRQAPETSARVDTARWEQNLGTWLPSDLTSAEWPIDTVADPDSPDDPTQAVGYAPYVPCPDVGSICDFGENIAHFAWDDGGAVDVSYRYGDVGGGRYEFRRVECSNGGGCTSITLVRDMPAPSSGGAPPITVTFPPPVLSTDVSGNEVLNTSGRRVTLTVTGAAGTDLLSFTGGGVERVDLEPAAIQPPEFLQARSGCGGPITLIVDESGSIGSGLGDVRSGVRSFVEAFAGTPTALKIIGFSNVSRTLDDNPNDASPEPRHYSFDLSEQSVVDLLLGGSSPINTLSNSGATNWEDALQRAFYNDAGQSFEAISNPATPAPELVVFFTDGLPTHDRDTNGQTGSETPEVASVPSHYDWDNTTVDVQFSPRGWYRAQWLLTQTGIRVIGVGVGPEFGNSVNLDRDTDMPDAVIAADWSAPYGGGSYSHPRLIPAEVALGDFVAENDLSNYDGDATGRFVKASYVGAWDPVEVAQADILTTTNFAEFGPALESIALAECGGTLTVQTRRVSDGSPLSQAVTYEVSGVGRPLTESTTSAVSKTAVFDIATDGGTSADVLLRPRTLDGTGFVPQSWTCRSRNVAITDPGKLSAAGGGPIDGLNLTIEANEAVSCILFVVPE